MKPYPGKTGFVCVVFLLLTAALAAPAFSRDLLFYVWSDSHFGNATRDSAQRRMIIHRMNTLPGYQYPWYYYRPTDIIRSPDFLLHCGDITDAGASLAWDDPSRDDYYSYIQLLKKLTATSTVYEVIGNHDTNTGVVRTKVIQRHGSAYYSFDAQGVHFVVLVPYPAPSGGGNSPDLDSAQLTWLSNDLNSLLPGTPIIIAMHVSPIAGDGGNRRDYLSVSSAPLYAILQDKNVLAILGGHFHLTKLKKWNAKIDVIVPAGYSYANYTSCTVGHCSSWALIRVTNNRITSLTYDWYYDTWGDSSEMRLDKIFWDPTLADMNHDRSIDFDDLATFADCWLLPKSNPVDSTCYISVRNSSVCVAFQEFAILAKHWLESAD